MKRERFIKVRFNQDEYDKLIRLAESDELSRTRKGSKNVSAYIRQRSLIPMEDMAAMQIRNELREIRYQIRKIGVNVNQTTKKINAGFGTQLDIEIMEEELKKMNAAIEQLLEKTE